MQRLLIVDDEAKIREVIRAYAEINDFEVEEAEDGAEAVEKCQDGQYDIIVMDVMMPKLDGFSAIKEIRQTKDIPVIMLSARSEEYDKLYGFEMGIDDYVTKPFSPKELLARINAVLARRQAQQPAEAEGDSAAPSETDVVAAGEQKFGGLVINPTSRTVSVDGERVEMTPKEYDLLFYLVDHKNEALARDVLLQDIWGYDFFGEDRTIDTHIKNLRNNLGGYRDHIVTVRGVGYKFED